MGVFAGQEQLSQIDLCAVFSRREEPCRCFHGFMLFFLGFYNQCVLLPFMLGLRFSQISGKENVSSHLQPLLVLKQSLLVLEHPWLRNSPAPSVHSHPMALYLHNTNFQEYIQSQCAGFGYKGFCMVGIMSETSPFPNMS